MRAAATRRPARVLADRALGDRSTRKFARLVGVVADEREVLRQRVVLDQLPAVRKHGDVPIGQRRPHADRGLWQACDQGEREPLGEGMGAGDRRCSGERQQIREPQALRPVVPQHLEVEPVNDVQLLAEQQRAVAAINQRRVVRLVAAVDLPPGLEGGRVDDSRVVELFDLG
jgi:hypothetical protein